MQKLSNEAVKLKEKYEKMASETKRHHWVPQFYLKNFSISKSDERVYMYRPNVDPELVGTSSIAVSKDLYTFKEATGNKSTRVMEAIFSEHEDIVAPIIGKIIESESIPDDEEDRSNLAAFVSFLYVRGPSFNEWMRNMDAEHLKLIQRSLTEKPEILRQKFNQVGVSFSSEKEFLEMLAFMRDPERYDIKMKGGEEHYFRRAVDIAKDIFGILVSNKSWHLLTSPHKRHFITSDNPVVIQELHDCPPHMASGLLNGTILLTISPRFCIAFRSMPLIDKVVNLNRKDVDQINKSVANSALRQLYAHLNSRDLRTICNEYLLDGASKVDVKRIVEYAPYYVFSGRRNLKESDGIRNNSITEFNPSNI